MGYSNGNRVFNAYRAMPSASGIKRNYNDQLLARRVNQLSRRVQLNTGELKKITFSADAVVTSQTTTVRDLTVIAQGDETYQREGNRIQITGVKIRMHCVDKNVDGYLTLSPHGINPTSASFTNVIMGHVTDAASQDVKELYFFKNFYGSNGNSTYNKRFKKPIMVKYLSSTSADVLANRLCFCLKNSTAVSSSVQYSIIVYYRDN